VSALSSSLSKALGAVAVLRRAGLDCYLFAAAEQRKIWVGASGTAFVCRNGELEIGQGADRSIERTRDVAGFLDALRHPAVGPFFCAIGLDFAPAHRALPVAVALRPSLELEFTDEDGAVLFSGPGLDALARAALDAAPIERTLRGSSVVARPDWHTEPDETFRARLAAAIQRVQGKRGKLIVTRTFELPLAPDAELLDLGAMLLGAETQAAAAHYFEIRGVGSLGTSPENVLEVIDGRLRVDAVAGTRPVDPEPERDEAFARELLANEKERAEHELALGRARAFAEKLCEAGSTEVVFERRVSAFRRVRHLKSRVEGCLLPGLDDLDLLRRAHPPLTSYPDELAVGLSGDPAAGGLYGGLLAHRNSSGGLTAFLNLRSVQRVGERLVTRGGVGVVDGSTLQGEEREILAKLRSIDEAVLGWASPDAARQARS
jgi:anthranilate/para-aminobenzoate synthase component I